MWTRFLSATSLTALLYSNASAQEPDTVKVYPEFHVGGGLTAGKLSSNTDIEGITGPNGESYIGPAFTFSIQNPVGPGFRLDYDHIILEKQFFDNFSPNTWKWQLRTLSLLGSYRFDAAPKTPDKVYGSFFGGPAFAFPSINIQELGVSGFSSGSVSSKAIGITVGGSLEVKVAKKLAIVIEPSFTHVQANFSQLGNLKYNVGGANVGIYLKGMFPIEPE